MPRYDPKRIEPKWQKYWEEKKTFRTPDTAEKPKLYVLDMFPYPSGEGLHVGHPEGYTATDILCRYQRMRGMHVLHPMGWDAFGLPAEDYARRTGTHPGDTTYKNIATFRRQLKMLGFSYDWDREFATTDAPYFRWTQWIFLVLFDTCFDPDCPWTDPQGKPRKGRGRAIAELPIPAAVRAAGPEAVRRYQDKHRLAYQAESPVNWCPALGTVLSNEEVIGGLSERGGHPVERLPLRQWMLRITAYCERLLSGLDDLDWSDAIKALQRNWIGRSEGAEVDFYISQSRDRDGPRAATDFPSDRDFQTWQQDRAEAGWPAEPPDDVLRIYTTRPDTLFGATYMVLAPEHRFVDRLTTPEQRTAVEAYRQQAAAKSDLDRTDLAKEKSGVFTGSYAINPVNAERIPIWIADYVLISYGTGAIMAVPAGDLRDWEFARAFGLPIRQVVEPPDGYEPSREEAALAYEEAAERKFPFIGEGTAVRSGQYDGVPSAEFKQRITADLAAQGVGRAAVNYRLRDWLFSRQHYWGEPFPILHELDENGEPTGLLRTVKEDALPVRLPEMNDFKPHGRPEPPLEEAPEDWLYVKSDDSSVADPLAGARGYGGGGDQAIRLKRETNTMPQWAGSCWYYLRFIDPKNANAFVDPEKERYWMPVDLYVGGAEHAVLHLLYARFWHMVLFDRGHLSTPEPFQRLVNQGTILGEPTYEVYVRLDENQQLTDQFVSADVAHREAEETGGELVVEEDDDGNKYIKGVFGSEPIPSEQVYIKNGVPYCKHNDQEYELTSRAYKMSKSRGNVINPDEVVDDYGADALRLYEMFMGPLEATKPWSMQGVEGISRFLGRVWRMIADEHSDTVQISATVRDVEPNEAQLRVLHKTVKAVTEDIDRLEFNTAISRMMEFVNFFLAQDPKPRAVLEPFVLLLSPFAPHLGEELWQLLGHDETLAYEAWPAYDEALTCDSEIEVPVQINGKVRSRITVAADTSKDELERAAMADAKVQANLDGKTIRKVIVVPGKLVNVVAK